MGPTKNGLVADREICNEPWFLSEALASVMHLSVFLSCRSDAAAVLLYNFFVKYG